MREKADSQTNNEEDYPRFVRQRAKDTDFRAEEKIKRIDELAEIIFTARSNYRKNKNCEDI